MFLVLVDWTVEIVASHVIAVLSRGLYIKARCTEFVLAYQWWFFFFLLFYVPGEIFYYLGEIQSPIMENNSTVNNSVGVCRFVPVTSCPESTSCSLGTFPLDSLKASVLFILTSWNPRENSFFVRQKSSRIVTQPGRLYGRENRWSLWGWFYRTRLSAVTSPRGRFARSRESNKYG